MDHEKKGMAKINGNEAQTLSNLRREWSLVRSMRSVDAEGRALAFSQCGLGLILVPMLYVC